jgi:cell division septation protein DedD
LAQTQDDAFHEIQLNGKQLVFLFMAATVVSVVIFLCGVLVGRGVRAERGGIAADSSVTSAEPTPAAPAPAPATAAQASPASTADPRAAAPPEAVDDLSYFNRLEKPNAPKEHLKTSGEKPASAREPAPADAKSARAASASAPSPSSKSAPPAKEPPAVETSGDFTVQVAALNARDEADAIAKRLSSKGYAAYVVAPGNGAVMFRVRIGHFKTRRDAEPVFAKLQKEEQFKPWITR